MSLKTSIKDIQTAEQLFEAIAQLKVLIIGDVMIDSYLWGKVDRISPEAPVPVVMLQKTDKRLGGAANVALNVQSLGAVPLLCSVVGHDTEGDNFFELLQKAALSDEGIVRSSSRVTTIKHRIISAGHHMLRLDSEQDHPLDRSESEQLITRLSNLIPHADVVIFEDYDKGVITSELITAVVKMCKELNIPTVVDPKKRNFLNYQNVSLFKPNKKELREGLKLDDGLNSIAEVKKSAALLRERLNPDSLLVTLSDQGVYYDNGHTSCHVAAFKREICDVSGAGDTVVSVAALCYALNLSPDLIASLSNLAGGIVCEQVGVVPIDRSFFQKEIIKYKLLGNEA